MYLQSLLGGGGCGGGCFKQITIWRHGKHHLKQSEIDSYHFSLYPDTEQRSSTSVLHYLILKY